MKPYYDDSGVSIYHGDCRQVLRALPDGMARCCVTSPPYFGLRDYGVDGQLGWERTPEQYVAAMVEVFREVRRVLADDGTLWLNIGDSYASAWPAPKNRRNIIGNPMAGGKRGPMRESRLSNDLKEKDLIGIPWMLAFALRADGWYLRQDIIWHKPNPMPESVTDRCTKAHEYLFLLSKSPRYYYDQDSVREAHAHPNMMHKSTTKTDEQESAYLGNAPTNPGRAGNHPDGRNKRSVWTVNPRPYPGAHFATFPPDLIEPCIKAGSAPGDIVLDPFNGSGTTGEVAQKWGRRYVGIELNEAYIRLSMERFRQGVLFGPKEAVA